MAYFLAMPPVGLVARSSIIVVFAATGLAGLATLLLRGMIDLDAALLSATALPGLFIGSRLGVIGFRTSSPKLHRPVALAVLGALATLLILRALVV